MAAKATLNIRGIDREIWQEARAAAVVDKKTIGEWLNEAIKAKLRKAKAKRR